MNNAKLDDSVAIDVAQGIEMSGGGPGLFYKILARFEPLTLEPSMTVLKQSYMDDEPMVF